MKFFQLFLCVISPMCLLFSSDMQTDRAVFLFDNGDKNMIASMLKFAREHDALALDHLNFRIVFMGASVDAMSKEPFCHYPDKLVHYKDLGVEEVIDHHWKRDGRLSQTSIENLSKSLNVQKKVWVGVSCSIFEQILEHYQDDIEVVALRDNPSPEGDTDYFLVADDIQRVAHKVAVPSQVAAAQLNKQVVVTGHGPIEEWCHLAQFLDKEKIIQRLGLNAQLPIIVYTGVYGEYYEDCFKMFLELVPDEAIQVLIVPHPRYKGIVEQKHCTVLKFDVAQLSIISEWEVNPEKNAKTIELLSIADVVITADATSTIVFQANALKKKVLYVNPSSSKVSDGLCVRKLLQKINNSEEFSVHLVKEAGQGSHSEDVFELLGIPRNGAQLLWEEFLR